MTACLPMVAEADDRRTCRQCTQLRSNGLCGAVVAGELVAARNYAPVPALLRRCEGYRPDRTDADRRPGSARWPALVWVSVGNGKPLAPVGRKR